MVRPETKPDDVHGMLAAEGIHHKEAAPATPGRTPFGKPAVVGVSELELDLVEMEVGGDIIEEGD